ncbi:MAG: hypothetical protein M1819_003424 [Sarea resinae]|nr:MAG: hypothetical protein M1819_003424 [Sarea resinae]
MPFEMEPINLNWRDQISTSQIPGDLRRIWGKPTKKRQGIGQWPLSWLHLRYTNPTLRDFRRYRIFYKQIMWMGVRLMKQINAGELMKYRMIGYSNRSNGMTKAQVKAQIDNWAVTIGVHPRSFGLQGQCNGEVSLSRDVEITVDMVNDVFKYHKNKPVDTARPGRVRGVMVTEHRNLATAWADQDEFLQGFIIVMTAGYPDEGTREFLCLLDHALQYKSVPFLWFSDHDLHGAQIFKTLKYGSVAQAWSSGPRKDQQCQKHLTLDENQLSQNAVVWAHEQQGKLTERIKKAVNKADLSAYKALEKSGILEHEPQLVLALGQMQNFGMKFSIAELKMPPQQILLPVNPSPPGALPSTTNDQWSQNMTRMNAAQRAAQAAEQAARQAAQEPASSQAAIPLRVRITAEAEQEDWFQDF